MDARFPGLLIRRARMEKNWSQEGLCSGICAVSYLSKIEQGKAEASEEIVALLLGRLDVQWHGGEEAEQARALAEKLYDAVFSMDTRASQALLETVNADRTRYVNGPYMLDFLLLERVIGDCGEGELAAFEGVFDARQRGLWLLLCGRYDELLRLAPSALAYTWAGHADYGAGRYAEAVERLRRGHELAAEDGRIYVMLQCRIVLGNCYSDLGEVDHMMQHYRAAARLAEAVGDREMLETIRYNAASTEMQFGRYQAAYDALMELEEPFAMSCHKLAVCCEQLGRPEEALAWLDKAACAPSSVPDHALAMEICNLVRYRLEHADYLHDAVYGERLLTCFARMCQELPVGYAIFHLPWLEAWYTANRQYKQAYELVKHFPDTWPKT